MTSPHSTPIGDPSSLTYGQLPDLLKSESELEYTHMGACEGNLLHHAIHTLDAGQIAGSLLQFIARIVLTQTDWFVLARQFYAPNEALDGERFLDIEDEVLTPWLPDIASIEIHARFKTDIEAILAGIAGAGSPEPFRDGTDYFFGFFDSIDRPDDTPHVVRHIVWGGFCYMAYEFDRGLDIDLPDDLLDANSTMPVTGRPAKWTPRLIRSVSWRLGV